MLWPSPCYGWYTAEVVYRRGPWRGREDLGFATLEWVDWFTHRRLLGAIGSLPPAEYEARGYTPLTPAAAGTP